MSIDEYFLQDLSKHTCYSFACQIWNDLTGFDIRASSISVLAALRHLKPLQEPVSPCVVLFERKGCTPHVGIYLRGSVLHLANKSCNYQPIEVVKLGFKKISYYK